jgi:hypothetical protein
MEKLGVSQEDIFHVIQPSSHEKYFRAIQHVSHEK